PASRARPGRAPAPRRCGLLPCRSLSLPDTRAARLAERRAPRLEDRLQDVLRLAALDQADVQREPGRARELVEEARRQIRREPADPRLGEVDVGDDERPSRGLEDDVA